MCRWSLTLHYMTDLLGDKSSLYLLFASSLCWYAWLLVVVPIAQDYWREVHTHLTLVPSMNT